MLAERHRLRTRDAFDLLRSAARTRGRRVIDIAEDVVSSTSNPLLRLPEELERKPEPRGRDPVLAPLAAGLAEECVEPVEDALLGQEAGVPDSAPRHPRWRKT